MDFGQNATPELDNQIPTYHVAPNFSILPSPQGKLHLGTLVNNLKDYDPINFGINNRVPIIDERCSLDYKGKVDFDQRRSSGGRGRILTKVLHAIRSKVSAQKEDYNSSVWRMDALETTEFTPPPSYYSQCLQLDDVKAFENLNDHKDPLYLITGLKTARGATMATMRSRHKGANAGAGIQGPEGPINLEIGGHAGAFSDGEVFSSFSEPADFIIGIQVKKIYHKTAFFGGLSTLKVKRVYEGAVLADDGPVITNDEGDEVDYEPHELDEKDMEGFAIVKDEDGDGAWVLPSQLA
ncbi:major facilitator superfamily MFS-1 [Fusarium globosum]|uniref:Major facilitator superfamily MFS-1 n=1 Tax=Fusarium globosum TaxID=78864 RepID=A0A8H5YK89_9HYPO|nr:major facilitator superfamily MFS-1 [Fusarium globosum]